MKRDVRVGALISDEKFRRISLRSEESSRCGITSVERLGFHVVQLIADKLLEKLGEAGSHVHAPVSADFD